MHHDESKKSDKEVRAKFISNKCYQGWLESFFKTFNRIDDNIDGLINKFPNAFISENEQYMIDFAARKVELEDHISIYWKLYFSDIDAPHGLENAIVETCKEIKTLVKNEFSDEF